ncbi:uncharacterized protein C17orf80 homolog isoform X2 [Elgaria multicarinata webbii]|uniref:uncharacterized protein C17orf80 homolog isoform X2 n=1 Tax=Elgaria multicarinata webbii TaxID=159646 RepID=UPI002FCD5824
MAGVETCPYCKKPFKRLKSHLPHCKVATGTGSSGALSPIKVCGSATSKLLNAEKTKGQIKRTETASKQENKKSKLAMSKVRGKTNSSEALEATGTATSSNLHICDDIQEQIKYGTENTYKTEHNTGQRTLEEVRAQPAEKTFSGIKFAKKSPTVQKSRSKTTSDEERFESGLALEPLILSGKSSSESPSQKMKPSAKKRQSKEALAKQNVSALLDSSVDDLQPIPQGVTDKIEILIENHRARVLRQKCESPIPDIPLNEATIDNHHSECLPPKSSLGCAEITVASRSQITTVKDSVDRKSMLGLELAGNTWCGEIRNGMTVIKAHTSDDHLVDSRRRVSSAPVELAAGVSSKTDDHPLFFKGEEYPKESPVYTSPKTNSWASFTGAIRESRDDETFNSCLTSLKKETALCSGTAIKIGDQNSGVSLRQPLPHMLEMTIAHWFTASGTGKQPSALGLEWFPELYPNYCCLGLFSRRQSQWDTRIPQAQVLILPSDGYQVPLAGRCLMDVKLQDLPAWLATRNLSPQGMLGSTHRAWNGYYNRYINVKKGGVAGISMLLLSYCVLSYAWNYEHIKHSRWRKYHW